MILIWVAFVMPNYIAEPTPSNMVPISLVVRLTSFLIPATTPIRCLCGPMPGALVTARTISSGGVRGPLDYFMSFTSKYRDGYRDHSRENGDQLFSDLGYKINRNLENRVYLTVGTIDRHIPGELTKDELNNTPTQANSDATAQDFDKNWSMIRLADKLTYREGHNEVNANVYWAYRVWKSAISTRMISGKALASPMPPTPVPWRIIRTVRSYGDK